MSLYPKLDYKRNKSLYSPDDSIRVVLNYYYKSKVAKFTTGVSIKFKDWNENHKMKNFVKKTDKDFSVKNSIILKSINRINDIILNLKVKGEEPHALLIKSNYRTKLRDKEVRKYKDVEFSILCDEFLKDLQLDIQIGAGGKKNVINGVKHLRKFVDEYSKGLGYRFTIKEIDFPFQREYFNYLTEDRYSIETIRTRFKHLRRVCNWATRTGYIDYSVQFITIKSSGELKEPTYLNAQEIETLWKFTDINYDNPNHTKHTETYITDERTRLKTKEKKYVKYTNLEVYRDMMLLLCSIGCRYSDLVNLKVNCLDIDDSKPKGERTAMVKFQQQKTKHWVSVPENNLSGGLIRKYSYGKESNDYLIPRNGRSSGIPIQKFNEHIKKIAKKCNLNRRMVQHKKQVMNSEDDSYLEPQPVHHWLSSHDGRRSFIRMGISKNLPTHILMRLSGHTTERIFRSYFSTLKEELVEFASPLFDEVSNEDDKGVVKKKPSVSVGDTDGLDELKKLKSLYEGGFISKEMWDSKVNKILN
jgi:integrase